MIASKNAEQFVRLFEGIDGKQPSGLYAPYICPADVYTVGYGHALKNSDGSDIDADKMGSAAANAAAQHAMLAEFGKSTLTLAECDQLLLNDLQTFSTYVSKDVVADTTQAQFDGMVSMAYNIGSGNFRTSSVVRLHNHNQRNTTFSNMTYLQIAAKTKQSPTTMPVAFVRWSNSNGKFSLGLFRRRVSEILLYSGIDAATAFNYTQHFNG